FCRRPAVRVAAATRPEACGLGLGRTVVEDDIGRLRGPGRTGRAAIDSCRLDRVDEGAVRVRIPVPHAFPAWILLGWSRLVRHGESVPVLLRGIIYGRSADALRFLPSFPGWYGGRRARPAPHVVGVWEGCWRSRVARMKRPTGPSGESTRWTR